MNPNRDFDHSRYSKESMTEGIESQHLGFHFDPYFREITGGRGCRRSARFRMDASGWNDYCEERRKKAETESLDLALPILDEDETDSDKARKHQILEICHTMESEREDEDTEMLIRLIKIRKHLWT